MIKLEFKTRGKIIARYEVLSNVLVTKTNFSSIQEASDSYVADLMVEGRTHIGTLMPQIFSSVLCSWCCSEQLLEQVALRILKQCCVAGVPIIAQSNVRNTTPYTQKLFQYLSVPDFVRYSISIFMNIF